MLLGGCEMLFLLQVQLLTKQSAVGTTLVACGSNKIAKQYYIQEICIPL